MDDETALAEIRRAAQATLDAWPDARAAVLFGSRARGTHRPDSDWDIAFITAGDGDRIGAMPRSLPFLCADLGNYVNDIAIPEKLIERKALCIGHVGRGIAVDGRVLAGHWSRPKMEGAPFMDADRYKRSIYTSLDMMGLAGQAAARITRLRAWEENRRHADRFVACTADAAEHLAKAVMGRHGVDAYHTHDLNGLADQAGLGALADDIARTNGATKGDHMAGYDGADEESLVHAIARLPVVVDRMDTELAALPADFLDPQEAARVLDTAGMTFREGAALLRDAIIRDGADMSLPEPGAWIMPLVRAREGLASTLDAAANALK